MQKKYLNFDFSIVFYDVTTLYFETFKDDKFRKCWFSKDNKAQQPQILITLVVNKDWYPISINMYSWNKFEWHTFIPEILKLKKKFNIKTLTIVADAAMLSVENIEKLKKHKLHYIVWARMSSLNNDILQSISSTLNKTENIYHKLETKYWFLVCDYSKKRASKDKSDRNKQIANAKKQLKTPWKINKRLRFVKEVVKSTFELDNDLIEKDQLLDWVKWYYTNLIDVENSIIVSRYKDLWKIEKAFRIAKIRFNG